MLNSVILNLFSNLKLRSSFHCSFLLFPKTDADFQNFDSLNSIVEFDIKEINVTG